MTTQPKPHVLTITLDEGCQGCISDDPSDWCSSFNNPMRCMNYAIDCPYVGDERLAVCMAYIECMCPPLEEPRLPEPKRTSDLFGGMGGTGYAFDQDVIAVAAWSAYYQREDDHDDEHPHGWKPTGHCWVQTGDHCWPEPLEGGGVSNEPGTHLIAVDNEGSYEDSVLVVYPWTE